MAKRGRPRKNKAVVIDFVDTTCQGCGDKLLCYAGVKASVDRLCRICEHKLKNYSKMAEEKAFLSNHLKEIAEYPVHDRDGLQWSPAGAILLARRICNKFGIANYLDY